MKSLEDLLLLGNPRLYEKSTPVLFEELHLVTGWVRDLHNVMEEIRRKYKFGRAIAAPQLGIMKRLIYMNIEKPLVIISFILGHRDRPAYIPMLCHSSRPHAIPPPDPKPSSICFIYARTNTYPRL